MSYKSHENQHQRVVSGPNFFELALAQTMIETIADRSLANIFSRENIAPSGEKKRKTQQTLQVYDAFGALSNPADNAEPYFDWLRTTVVRDLERKTRHLSVEEIQAMSNLVPRLTTALALTETHVDRVYAPELPNMISIAADWFIRPDEVNRTHFRIGMGGTPEVNGSRLPAYVVPAFTSLEKIRDVYGNYTNWAVHRGLHHEVKSRGHKEPGNAAQIDSWVSQEIQDLVSQRAGQTIDQKTSLEQILQAEHITFEEVRQILDIAWQKFAQQTPDMQHLGQEYHFTDKLPQIVVFNAANAAIEINGMDPEGVITARDTTQRFLRAYAQKFHPAIASNLRFQNDQPWSEHTYGTRMRVLYTGHIIDQQNGERMAVARVLNKFGEHHQQDADRTVLGGMSGADAYAKLHTSFFEDPQQTTKWNEKLPPTNVMENIGERPAHVIYHQGEPEIKFGAYRKIAAEHSDVSGFITFLSDMAHLKESQILELIKEITSKADEALGDAEGSTYLKHLTPALGKLGKEHARAKNILMKVLGEPSFDSNPNKQAAWHQHLANLEARLEEIDVEESKQLIAELREHQERINKVTDQVTTAYKRGDHQAIEELMATDIGQLVAYPRTKLEIVISPGDTPVYYPVEGADSITWPVYEDPSAAKFEGAKTQARRNSNLAKRVTQEWIAQDQPLVIDSDEGEATTPDSNRTQRIIETADRLQATWAALIDQPTINIPQAVTDFNRTHNVLGEPDILVEAQAMAQQAWLQDLAAHASQVIAAEQDYQVILGDINAQDRTAADEHYRTFVRGFFQPGAEITT